MFSITQLDLYTSPATHSRRSVLSPNREIAAATREIEISKSGFERSIALAARNNRLLYGLACVILSLGLGWAAATVFRRRI